MTPLRKRLIEITANMGDEPAQTMIDLEEYVTGLVNDAFERGCISVAERRAYSLYFENQNSVQIMRIICNEYPNINTIVCAKIVNDAREGYMGNKQLNKSK